MTPFLETAIGPAWGSAPHAPQLGRYLLGPELGRGGMGVVHRAWDPLLKRPVALKLLLHADPLQALRFLREAQAQAKVDHPRICKVFEVSAEGDRPFIAMQLLQGRTLGEVRDLDLREKAWIMAEVAGALHAAHRQGLIHRDLKPANILLEDHGEKGWVPFLVDFGLARDLSTADHTLTWGLVGTPAFMSPEQARGEDLTPASDLYSLGATFYAVFAGRPPLEATTLAGLLTQQGAARIPTLRRLHPGFPRDLETILLKCLEPESVRRYATAFALEEDLRRWLAGEPIHARPVSLLEHAWRRVRRHRALSLAIAAGFVASMGLLTWNVRSARRARIQVELAQRFSLQVREVEQMMRIERMLAPHDIRPAETQVRRRMDEIRDLMRQLGRVAHGPGHYALGRGHLVLREFDQARRELETAWNGGFRTPETAYALGLVDVDTYMDLGRVMATAPDAHRKAAGERLIRDGIRHFREAKGFLMEDPVFGEAQIAFLEGDYPRCIQGCVAAFAQRPWFYEAKLVEAEAWNRLAWVAMRPETGVAEGCAQGRRALERCREAFETAMRIAPSDERAYGQELSRMVTISYFEADTGTPDPATFTRSDALYGKIAAIRPDNMEVTEGWIYSRVRQGMSLLRTGQDVRPLMRDTLEKGRALADRVPEFSGSRGLAQCHWLLADGQWRRGEDPRPALRAFERSIAHEGPDLAQALCIEAEFLASRGQDPTPVLARVERILSSASSVADKDFYHHTLWGHLLQARAAWEAETGKDPKGSLALALSHIDQGLGINPKIVYMWAFKGQFLVRRALQTLQQGGDPMVDLQAAIACTERARQCGAHYRTALARAEARRVEALFRMTRGEDPGEALLGARTALREGWKLNDTDHRLFLEAVQLELTAARQALRGGQSPLSALGQAETLARRGLQIKPDCTRLWLCAARAARLRSAWIRQSGGDPVPALEQGRRDLARALALNPNLLEAQAERAALDLAADPGRTDIREALQATLRRNPFLGLEYGNPALAGP